MGITRPQRLARQGEFSATSLAENAIGGVTVFDIAGEGAVAGAVVCREGAAV